MAGLKASITGKPLPVPLRRNANPSPTRVREALSAPTEPHTTEVSLDLCVLMPVALFLFQGIKNLG